MLKKATLADGSLVASRGDISLEADLVSLGNSALVATGTDEDGTQGNVGTLTVEADQLDAGNGQLAAGDILTVSASSINLDRSRDDDTDVLRSLGAIVLNTDGVTASNARVTSLGDLAVLSTSSLDLTGGVYSASGDLLVEGGEVTSDARLNAQGQASLSSTDGGIFNAGQVSGDSGFSRETIRHVEIEADGGITINAGEGIVIEYQKTGNLDASIDQLARSPGLEWMESLRNDPRIDWVEVQAHFDEWDYESQGLTEAGGAVVSLVVGAVSAGALSSLSATLTQGLSVAGNSFAQNAFVQNALQAGLSTISSQPRPDQ